MRLEIYLNKMGGHCMSVKSEIIGLNEKYKATNNKGKYIAEKVAKNIFFISALVAVVSLLLIL